MTRFTKQFAGVLVCLAINPGCSGDGNKLTGSLETLEQEINVEITVPAETYRFAATGSCELKEDFLRAEGQSEDGVFSIDVSKDPYSGMIVIFSNNEDEWEVIIEADEDESERDGNHFRFSGKAALNYDESNMQEIDVKLVCPKS